MRNLTYALVVLCAVLVCLPDVQAGWGDCYETWSRCSRWSSPLTWQSCTDRCKSLGRSGGDCVLTPSKYPISEKAYQCQCF